MVLTLLAALIGPGTPLRPGQQIQPPRVDATIVVDGRLDEPVWAQAVRLDGFSRYQPSEGPATDSTVVLVWYSATAIHFGIRAYEAHGTPNATLADRDHIGSDDNVQIFLDTYHDRTQAIVLAVNPLGVQADGTLIETGRTGGGFAATVVGGREPTDVSPDFVWQSKGRVTPWGYEVEIRVPFKSLRYQTAGVQTWGLQVVRQIQHAGEEDTWTPARRDAASFLGQEGTLEGLTEMRRGLVMDVTPELTRRWQGDTSAGGWHYTPDDWRLGGTVRWGLSENLSLNGTVRPDFSQVEADASQIQFDPRVALFFAERRPFFLDGLELFNTPNNLIYTRSLVQPDAAVKLTGKAEGTNIGVIAGLDGKTYSASGNDRPKVLMSRFQRNLAAAFRLGVVYTDRTEPTTSNRVLGVDGRYTFGGVYSATFQLAGSRTADGSGTTSAPLWSTRFTRSGRHVGFRTTFSGVSDKFETRSGFIGRNGIVDWTVDPSYTWEHAPTALLQRLTADVLVDYTWQYQHFTAGEHQQDKKLHLNTTALLRGGWSVAAGWFIEQFGYDSALYGRYRILKDTGGGNIDTLGYVGTATIPNSEVFLQVNTPQFQRVNASGFALYGHDENFYEWSSSWLWIGNLTVNWRPTDQVRLGASYDWQTVNRRTDHSNVNTTQIPRLTLEYQVARPLFVRLIAEYTRSETDSLRDDSRTGLPVYFQTPDSLVRAGPRTVNRVRMDALLSYRPTPGTVLFLGYGSQYRAADAYKFSDLQRTTDAFFVKLSYLFRV